MRRRRAQSPQTTGQLTFEDALNELADEAPQAAAEGPQRTEAGAASPHLATPSEPAGDPPEETEEARPGQLVLLGEAGPDSRRGRAGAIPSEVWSALLGHEATRQRYEAKTFRREPGACWYWTGAISSTGHGKLKAAREGGPSIVVTAHAYGYQAAHGVIVARPGEDLVIGHTCDEASCQNPAHWELIPREQNDADYRARRWRRRGPLADVRGAHGRAVAIRAAILAALAEGGDVEAAIAAAAAAGLAEVDGLF